MSAIALEAKRPSASQCASHRPSGVTHFYRAQTSSTAGAKNGSRSTLARNDGVRGSSIRIRNEYDCQYRHRKMIAISKFISRGERSLGVRCSRGTPLRRVETDARQATLGALECRWARQPPGRSVQASRRPTRAQLTVAQLVVLSACGTVPRFSRAVRSARGR